MIVAVHMSICYYSLLIVSKRQDHTEVSTANALLFGSFYTPLVDMYSPSLYAHSANLQSYLGSSLSLDSI